MAIFLSILIALLPTILADAPAWIAAIAAWWKTLAKIHLRLHPVAPGEVMTAANPTALRDNLRGAALQSADTWAVGPVLAPFSRYLAARVTIDVANAKWDEMYKAGTVKLPAKSFYAEPETVDTAAATEAEAQLWTAVHGQVHGD